MEKRRWFGKATLIWESIISSGKRHLLGMLFGNGHTLKTSASWAESMRHQKFCGGMVWEIGGEPIPATVIDAPLQGKGRYREAESGGL